jgi:peptide/nickel transport system permease protein
MTADGAPLSEAPTPVTELVREQVPGGMLGDLAAEDVYRPPTFVHGARGWLKRFVRTKFGLVAIILMVLLIGMAIFAPILAPYNPDSIVGPPFASPFGHYFFGTDEIGRDVLSNFIYGARVSMLVGAASGLVALILGCVIGGLAGYLGGVFDVVLMRIAELFMVIPSLILAVVVVALLGSQLLYIVLIIGFTLWPQEARIARSQFLTLRERDFVQGARVAGFRWRHIVFREILPNAIAPVIVQVTLDAGSAILLEAGLSFLGLGDPSIPSWGTMLQNAQGYLTTDEWLSIFPGIGILFAVLAFNFLGHALNEVMNPRAPRVPALSLARRMLLRTGASSMRRAASQGVPEGSIL